MSKIYCAPALVTKGDVVDATTMVPVADELGDPIDETWEHFTPGSLGFSV